MYIPKRYGESHMDMCPFCGRQAINKNSQGIPVCKDHKESNIPEMKCMCGAYLMMQKGKFGVFFNCLKCGNMNLKKVLEMNPSIMKAEKAKEKVEKPEIAKKQASREQTVRSDDMRYF